MTGQPSNSLVTFQSPVEVIKGDSDDSKERSEVLVNKERVECKVEVSFLGESFLFSGGWKRGRKCGLKINPIVGIKFVLINLILFVGVSVLSN